MNRLLSRTPVGIRFGNYVFSDPVPLDRFSLPLRSTGIFVVLMPDPSWGPWHFQPLFFGEFRSQRESHMSPAEQVCCLKVAAGRGLYAAGCTLPEYHGCEVSLIRNGLIESYRPVSNLASTDAAAGVGYRLDTLEKKLLEQDVVLKLALAALGQMVQTQTESPPEPPPEPKKKIAGFQPLPAGPRRG